MNTIKDKFKHLLACSLVSFTASTIEAACGAEYHNAYIAGFLAGIAIGVGKEYGDQCASDNKWDWGDICADTLGSAIGASLGALFSLLVN